jgi:pilus assembly protein FimV
VAHFWRKGSRPLAAIGAALVASIAHDAFALALGDPRVRSSLGDPLDLRVPVTVGSGESIEPACFSLARDPGDMPRITGARISIERSAAGAQLRIETRTPVNEPAFTLGIVASCPGQSGEYKRDFQVLLDPPAAGRAPPSLAAAPAIARAQPDSPSLRAIAATLIARIGDTLESIANAIFPRNRPARKAYIEALRDTNPALATLGENEPIPIDTPIALPDLRTFARSRPPHATQVARDEGKPAPRREARAAPARSESPAAKAPPTPRVARAPAPLQPEAPRTTPAAAPQRAATTPRRAREADGDGFVLRLSSAQVDLTRSRAIDDRQRAQLRERQMILDADDQVAAVLALRHSVKQLESRVAELQLKLAGMPSSFPPPRAEAPKAEPPKVEPPKVEAARVEPPKVEPPKVEAAKVEPPKVEEAPKVAQAAPVPETPKATPEPKSEPAPVAAPPRPVVRRTVTEREWLNYGLWVLAVLLLFAAAYLAWRLWQRRRGAVEYEEAEEPQPEVPAAAAADDQIVVADEHVAPPPEPARPEYSADGRRIIDADVELPTRLGNDSEDLRRRYIEERFPEITKGAIDLDDADSIVKGARLFYEDGAIARAVELLQYAIERKPSEVKSWLALFEIFRLERLSGEFAALAQRFREHHGASPFWPKVQYFGREIDPGNVLYQAPPIDKFETIGPTQARRIAAESTFDPIAENWLGAPMDFENEVLANELRKAVMAEAGIQEGDLLPNPMPALRNVEMFTVA